MAKITINKMAVATGLVIKIMPKEIMIRKSIFWSQILLIPLGQSF
jgi:hypothetical protein